jgi:hypothetical protein
MNSSQVKLNSTVNLTYTVLSTKIEKYHKLYDI